MRLTGSLCTMTCHGRSRSCFSFVSCSMIGVSAIAPVGQTSSCACRRELFGTHTRSAAPAHGSQLIAKTLTYDAYRATVGASLNGRLMAARRSKKTRLHRFHLRARGGLEIIEAVEMKQAVHDVELDLVVGRSAIFARLSL